VSIAQSLPGEAAETALRPAPRHLAIIMDGNGRWAKARGLPRAAGHHEGVEALRRAVDACPSFGIEHLTVFSFSTENWNRPRQEIEALLDLLRMFVRTDLDRLHREGVCVRIIGSRIGLSQDILDLVDRSMALTRDNRKLILNIAFNYGGRADIVAAAQRLARAAADGKLDPNAIDESLFGAELWSSGSPDPDLILRTSGELRLSNFLLWSGAYAELMFLDLLWPDFDRSCMEKAIDAFRRRDRRYGGLAP
jgi:undecaprenyl diphosphate synthase